MTGPYSCTDVNECETPGHGCAQKCVNLDGSYNCICEFGFELTDDRKTCKKVSDPCAKYGSLSCDYGCRVTETNGENTVACFCATGFNLAPNGETCLDVNECESSDLNTCSEADKCVNIDGGFTCSCSAGFYLANDGVNCTACDSQHYGLDCAEACDCSALGASGCDPVQGCQCNTGWSGDKCETDKDECDTVTCQENAQCKNTPGSYKCLCNDGYELNSTDNSCQDIDECSGSNICDQKCTNFAGGYKCTCNSGFQWSEPEQQCQDIDECETGKDDCSQVCYNSIGDYLCACYTGYKIDSNDLNNCIQTDICARSNCSDGCRVDGSSEICFCNKTRQFITNSDTDCEDINECESADTHSCQQTCHDETPGYSCSCSAGFQLNDDSVSCRECDDWKYDDCETDCRCVVANSESCNKVNGSCSCKTGWEGDNCETDKDECLLETANCTAHSSCVNTNGSYTCKCSIGYVKSSDGTCSPCDKIHYGENCASQCSCHVTNSESCNPVDGMCTCKNGWEGADCTTDKKECDADPDPCVDVSHSHCTETPGSFSCDCDDGYRKRNGTCININECLEGSSDCLQVCTDSEGAYTCSCEVGYQGTENNCEACSDWSFGVDCAESCSCVVNNTATCDKVNGSCTCQAGWKGSACDTDIDECQTANITCQDNAQCHNYNGSYICNCNEDFFLTQDECQPKYNKEKEKIFKFTLVLAVIIPLNKRWTVANDNDPKWRAVKNESEAALDNYYRNIVKLKGYLRVIILSFELGSLKISHNVVMNDTETAGSDLASAMVQALSGTQVVYDNQPVSAIAAEYTEPDTGNTVTVTPSQVTDVCSTYVIINPCPADFECVIVNEKPSCEPSKKDNIDMVIGLGVGIPLFLIVCLIIGILIAYNKRVRHMKRSRGSQEEMHRSMNNGFFSGVIPTKFNSLNRLPFYSPGGWDAESETSRDTEDDHSFERHHPKRSSSRDNFDDLNNDVDSNHYYYDNQAATSNFSWDFMYNFFDGREKYEIKRPTTDLNPNPVYREKKNRDSSA